jgi:phospholipid/cholesterol/gamma-HCH transport system ATP-binding protein
MMPDELSGGMKKRVGIARALALKPSVMLYDEPTTGLDPITAYSTDQLIVHLGNTIGVTSLVVSHDVSSVFRVADQIAFLDEGELAFFGDVKKFGESNNAAIKELIEKSESRELTEGFS